MAEEPARPWTHYRAVIANKKRYQPDADVTEEARALKAARLEEHIRCVVSSAPALTAEQIGRIRALLPAVPDNQRTAA